MTKYHPHTSAHDVAVLERVRRQRIAILDQSLSYSDLDSFLEDHPEYTEREIIALFGRDIFQQPTQQRICLINGLH